jgi:hypothetical protein
VKGTIIRVYSAVFALSFLAFSLFPSCASRKTGLGIVNLASEGEEISAQGAVGRVESAVSGPLYAGDGGRDIRLVVLAPESQGNVPATCLCTSKVC